MERRRHAVELQRELYTHMLLDPVSRMTESTCGGRPTPSVPTYCVSRELTSSTKLTAPPARYSEGDTAIKWHKYGVDEIPPKDKYLGIRFATPDMVAARAAFKRTFTEIGKEWPSHFDTLERQAAEWMARNNRVLLSIRCVDVKAAAAAAAAAAVAVVSVIGARALLR